MRMNPLQLGLAIVMSWFIVFVIWGVLIQPIINPSGMETFWGVLLLGLSFIGVGFIMKDKTSSLLRATTLMQIGVAVTIMWVMILTQMEGPYDLGLPKPRARIGSITISLIPILFLVFPVLGLILLAVGMILKRDSGE